MTLIHDEYYNLAMIRFEKIGTLFAALLVAIVVWLFSFQEDKEESGLMASSPALQVAVNRCDGITERAAAHLDAKVPFQKLEIAGRKAHVFKMCMQDSGYVENPNWTTYRTPKAKDLAKKTQVSVDAALESLRRVDMIVAVNAPGRPLYWVHTHAQP